VYGHRSEKRTIPISGSLALRWPASDRSIPADMRARHTLAAIAGTAAAHFASAGLDAPAPVAILRFAGDAQHDGADQRNRGEPDREGALDQPANQAAAVLGTISSASLPKGWVVAPLFELLILRLIQVVQREPRQPSEFAKEPGESSLCDLPPADWVPFRDVTQRSKPLDGLGVGARVGIVIRQHRRHIGQRHIGKRESGDLAAGRAAGTARGATQRIRTCRDGDPGQKRRTQDRRSAKSEHKTPSSVSSALVEWTLHEPLIISLRWNRLFWIA
jgi:hypothetical protein